MKSWEVGPTPYAGPTSPARTSRAELGTLGAAMAPLWLDVLDETAGMCAAYRRADLVEWLQHRRAQLLDPQLRVLVVGTAKQGKSQLINALVNAPVCAVSDDVGTTVPTVVRHAATPAAFLIRRAPGATDWTAPGTAGPQDRVALPIEDKGVGTLSAEQLDGHAHLLHAEIGVPRELLASGLTLIDTPPLDDPAGLAAVDLDVRAMATHARADLVLLACESTRDLSSAEVDLLVDLGRMFPSLLVVLTKTDFAPHWRRAVEHNRQCLAQAGVSATIVAVSAALRLHAARTGDPKLNSESGFPQLVGLLKHAVEAKPDGLARATVGLIGRTAIEQLVGPLREELAAQQGDGTSDAMARLHEAQRRVDELRRCATRWQNCLSDEIGDLMSDIEFDLRERTRAILSRSEETFSSADPAKVWDTFEPWLQRALQEAAEASFAWLVERTEWMARRVADQFPADAGARLPQWTPAVPDDLSDRVAGLNTPEVERFTASQKVFTGLRGSYGGVLMFGLATSLSGMSLINPISLGAGAVFGGKSIRDESKSLLKRRQGVAKTAVQRHVDEVFVRLNKDAKDTIRRVQRVLRDHFGAVTEDLQEAIVESLRSAKQAADHDVAAREQQLRRVQQELSRLAALYEQAQALARVGGVPSAGKLAGVAKLAGSASPAAGPAGGAPDPAGGMAVPRQRRSTA